MTIFVVEQSRGFFVQVSSSKAWETPWTGLHDPWFAAKIATGNFAAIKGNKFLVVVSEPVREVEFTRGSETRVVKAGSLSRAEDISAGERVAITYTARKGERLAQEVLVGTPDWQPLPLFVSFAKQWKAVTLPHLVTGARFQVGTVERVEPFLQPKGRQSGELVIDTKTPRGSRKWRVTRDTEVVIGMLKLSPGEIRAGKLVPIGAKELKGSPIQAPGYFCCKT